MKPTHQSIDSQQDVIAWQVSIYSAIPIWVSRIFLRVGSTGIWQGTGTHGEPVVAQDGDWIIRSEDRAFVLTDSEFKNVFRAIP